MTSTLPFVGSGTSTDHPLSVTVGLGGDGNLRVTVDGDFGQTAETATVSVEGTTLGTVGTAECGASFKDFPVTDSQLLTWMADGVGYIAVSAAKGSSARCRRMGALPLSRSRACGSPRTGPMTPISPLLRRLSDQTVPAT